MTIDDVKIGELPSCAGGRFYIFTDLAGLFWPEVGPDDHMHKSNHNAEELVIERMRAEGATSAPGAVRLETPVGPIGFDSEAGMFECHAQTREPVEWALGIIRQVAAQVTT